MRVCELKQKEVINICTCKTLGCPLDVEFNCKTGKIEALIVPVPGKMCGLFGSVSEYVVFARLGRILFWWKYRRRNFSERNREKVKRHPLVTGVSFYILGKSRE